MADTKAIFIDAGSLFHMMRILGIGAVKDAELFQILTKEIGSSANCFGRPLFVVRPVRPSREKYLHQVGFEVVNVPTYNSRDDNFINRKMLDLTPEQVSEIILVSADLNDYLSCLKSKTAQGLSITCVATKVADPKTGRAMVPAAFDEIISENKIKFVELEQYKERLMKEPWRDKDPAEKTAEAQPEAKTDSKNKVFRRLEITLEVPSESVSFVLSSLGGIIALFPEMKSQIKIQ